MTIFGFLLFVVVLGVILWLVCRFIPMDPTIKTVLIVLCVAIILLVFVNAIGGLGGFDRPLPRLH